MLPLKGALAKIEMEGIQTEIIESKGRSGGYLAIFQSQTDEYKSRFPETLVAEIERNLSG